MRGREGKAGIKGGFGIEAESGERCVGSEAGRGSENTKVKPLSIPTLRVIKTK